MTHLVSILRTRFEDSHSPLLRLLDSTTAALMDACAVCAIATLALVTLALPVAASHPTPLTDAVLSSNVLYPVFFTNDNPYDPNNIPGNADLNYFPRSLARVIADSLDEAGSFVNGDPNGHHSGYAALLFDVPALPPFLFTNVYYCDAHGDGCDSGSASPSFGIRMPADRYISKSPARILSVIGHEFFHHIEYGYVGSSAGWGDASIEGMARLMEDKIYDDLDGVDSQASYLDEINGYLGSVSGAVKPIWNSKYRTALFWNYLTEQYGNDMNEPHIGSDFIRKFWETARLLAPTPNTPHVTELTLDSYVPGTTLPRVFRDFANVNIAKEFAWNVPGYPVSKFVYIDEQDGYGITYDAVKRQSSDPLSTIESGIGASPRWHASYHEVLIQPECQGVVGFEARPDDPMAFSLLGIKNGVVESFTESKTRDFSRTWLQDEIDPYTRLLAVGTAIETNSAFRYTFACGNATVDILWPTVKFQAFVGQPDAEESFSIQLRVAGPIELGFPSVRGLEQKDFRVYVGSAVSGDEARIVSFSESEGDYFIKATAPIKGPTADGLSFPLIVVLGNWSDTEVDAIVYDVQILDEMIVLDVSGSMGNPSSYPKLKAAKVAAPAFVDILDADDLAGFVTFAGNATLQIALAPATLAQRNLIKTAIDATSASGSTSIGDGLAAARDEIITNGSVLGENWILLLSDGAENEPVDYASVSQSLIDEEITVHTVALGGSSDRPKLERIAKEHGGEPFYVHDGESPESFGSFSLANAASVMTTAQYEIDASAPLANRLADTYLMAWEDRTTQSRLWEVQGTVAALDIDSHQIVVTEGGLSRGRIAIIWDEPAAALTTTVYDPNSLALVDGVGGVQIFNYATHTVIHKDVLAPGTYTIDLAAGTGDVDYVGMLSGRSIYGADLDLFFASVPDPAVVSQGGTYAWGEPMLIKATLNDSSGPLLGATLTANIRHPDGSVLTLPLFDDGDHEDGHANDGVYGHVYTRTTEASPTNIADNGPTVPGGYQVRVVAFGSSSGGENFVRIKKGSFNVFALLDPSPDTDGDGMPDVYENVHSCLDPLIAQEGLDPDFDTLLNLDEWGIGTDPCYSDTDRGGESDASEVLRAANPFDPDDDIMTPPIDPIVIDYVPDHYEFYPLASGRNLIRYPSAPEWQSVRIWRSLSATGPFAMVANVALDGTGFYHDDSLVDGTTYYYMVQGEGLSNVTSAMSHVFSGTPKTEPFPNVGSVEINGQAPYADTTAATLTLKVVEPDVAEMKIANDPDLASASWQPYAVSLAWILSPKPSGQAQVYAQFRDTSQNVSRIYSDAITMLSPGALGTLTGIARYDDQANNVGIIMLLDDPIELPGFTNQAGTISTNVHPGTYELVFSADGYVSETRSDIVVTSGSTADFGVVILPEPDEILLLCAGGLFLGLARYRRSRSKSRRGAPSYPEAPPE